MPSVHLRFEVENTEHPHVIRRDTRATWRILTSFLGYFVDIRNRTDSLLHLDAVHNPTKVAPAPKIRRNRQ